MLDIQEDLEIREIREHKEGMGHQAVKEKEEKMVCKGREVKQVQEVSAEELEDVEVWA